MQALKAVRLNPSDVVLVTELLVYENIVKLTKLQLLLPLVMMGGGGR